MNFAHFNPLYPQQIISTYGIPRDIPRSHSVTGMIISGNSVGFGLSSAQGAYGEFYERNHFIMGVSYEKMGYLASYCSASLKQALCNMINQVKQAKAEPESHQWRLTRVSNLFNEKLSYYPLALISLSRNKTEEELIPRLDSCGNAAHKTRKDALYSAMMEFVERQSLILSWLSGKVRLKINPNVLLQDEHLSSIANKLCRNGSISIFECAHGFVGYCIVIMYFANDERDKVQYSIGVAYDLDISKALYSALMELWQDYIYLYSVETHENIFSKNALLTYNYQHINDNSRATRKLINFSALSSEVLDSISALRNLKSASWDELLQRCYEISPHFYYYHHYDKVLIFPRFSGHHLLKNHAAISNCIGD